MSFISGKNGSFGFFSVWLCVGKNQMCHLCGGNYHIFFFLHAAKNHLSLFRWFRSFTMNANVLWYGVVRDYEAKTYQFTPTFFTSHQHSKTAETRMHYTMCYGLVILIFRVYSLSLTLFPFAFLSFLDGAFYLLTVFLLLCGCRKFHLSLLSLLP
jgi:hypothetical protein